MAEQMKTLDQVVFSGLTHAPVVDLSESLMTILPDNQQKLFFSDNGSTTVEVGIKMALQYHFNRGEKRNVILAFEEGFHGDTFGAMSASGLSVYNGPFEDFFLNVQRIPVPNEDNLAAVLRQLKEILENYEVAAFVYEPLIQGAAAMKMHKACCLNHILTLLKHHGVVTIADEVMTGFGKTGTYFASDQVPTKPDIMCLSKALTAGLLPMGITSCTQEIYDAFYDDDMAKGFFHGHTYSANPLACRAALAGIDLLKSEEIQNKLDLINQWHTAFQEEMEQHPKVKSTRLKGVVFALDVNTEMSRYGNLRDQMFNHFLDKGVFLRPLGSTIYILAPYVISKEEMDKVYNAIRSCLEIV